MRISATWFVILGDASLSSAEAAPRVSTTNRVGFAAKASLKYSGWKVADTTTEEHYSNISIFALSHSGNQYQNKPLLSDNVCLGMFMFTLVLDLLCSDWEWKKKKDVITTSFHG